jgi:hypothetical protein
MAPHDAMLSERCKHTTAIVLLNGLVIFESVFMLARATNPFFGAMEKPTPPFIAFMLLQIALLGAGVLLTVGTCACKEKLVLGNRFLFFAVAVANVVYSVLFFVTRKDVQGGVTFVFAALLAVFGAMLCARFLLMLSHERLPTQSPAFTPHKDIRVK